MIPKQIHLCWLSGDPYPSKIKKCIESWQKYLPDYEIILWDTKRFDLNSAPWVKQAFESKKYAFAADYIRFYALYHYGGIYLDSDVEVLKSFDDLLDRPYFLGEEADGVLEAAILGAEKRNDWIKNCLDYYEGRNFLRSNGELDTRQLPEIMQERIRQIKPIVFMREGNDKPSKSDMDKAVYVFPNDYFSPKVFDSMEVITTPRTYAIHHYQSSWFSPKTLIYYKIRSFFVRLLGYNLVRKIEKTLLNR